MSWMLLDHFYGQLVERKFPAFADFKGRAEGRVVFLERFQYGGALVLE